MKPHLIIRPTDAQDIKIIKALIGTWYELENATNSFKHQVAQRELKSLFKSTDEYLEAVDRENARQGQDHADGHAASDAEGSKENPEHSEPPVLQAGQDGKDQSPVQRS